MMIPLSSNNNPHQLWFIAQLYPLTAFPVKRMIINSNGNKSGNPNIATNAALLFAFDTIPATNVNVLDSPIEPNTNPIKYCSLF